MLPLKVENREIFVYGFSCDLVMPLELYAQKVIHYSFTLELSWVDQVISDDVFENFVVLFCSSLETPFGRLERFPFTVRKYQLLV